MTESNRGTFDISPKGANASLRVCISISGLNRIPLHIKGSFDRISLHYRVTYNRISLNYRDIYDRIK
jgi:hypothetical protein